MRTFAAVLVHGCKPPRLAVFNRQGLWVPLPATGGTSASVCWRNGYPRIPGGGNSPP